MKKIIASSVALLAAVALTACGEEVGPTPDQVTEEPYGETEITLWTFQVGNWGNLTAVTGLIR